jgi:O-antigen/teichoic acid export membrane protein
MSLSRAIAGNTAVQIAGKFIGTLLGLLTVSVMARHLGQAGYGRFTTVTSFLQFFGILVDFGLTLTMIRMVSRHDADEPKIASNIISLRFVSGAVFFGLAPLAALFFPYDRDIKAGIALATLSFLAISLSQVLTGIFQKHLAVHKAALAEVVGRAVLFGGVLFAARYGGGLDAIIIALVAGNVTQFLLSFIAARKLTTIRPAFDAALWKQIIIESWPIGVSIAFNLIYLKGDVLILSLVRPQAEVGLYGAAYKVLDVITVIPTVFMGVVLPVLATDWQAGRRDEFRRRMGRAFDFMAMISIPLAIGALAVSRDLMVLVAGKDFAESGLYLAVLMFAGLAVFFSALFGHAIVAAGAQRKMILAYAIDAAISVVLYFALVPKLGGLGAAFVTVFSEVFIALIAYAAMAKIAAIRPQMAIAWRALVAALVMYGVLYALSGIEVLIRIAIGMLVYFGALYALGGIPKEAIAMFGKTKPLPV